MLLNFLHWHIGRNDIHLGLTVECLDHLLFLSLQCMQLEQKDFSTSGKLNSIGHHVSEKPALIALNLGIVDSMASLALTNKLNTLATIQLA